MPEQIPTYVLITAARNEEAFIANTLHSVVAQTVLPQEWVVVSDGSSDQTDAIVSRFAEAHAFIRLLRLDNSPQRSFASVVWALEAGIKALRSQEFDFIAILDADVRFDACYF